MRLAIMNKSRRFVLLASALAVILAVGSLLSIVQATDMTMKMAMSDSANGGDTTASDANLCPACEGNADDTVASNCMPLCHLTTTAIFSSTEFGSSIAQKRYAVSLSRSPHAWSGGVDPSPPKTLI